MHIQICSNLEQFDHIAAQMIIDQLKNKADSKLGLATGGTPIGMYRQLVNAFRQGEVSFRHAVTFNLDEYVGLQETHPYSYHAYMRLHLFRHIDLPADQAFIPNGMAPDLQAECRRYDEALDRVGQIDLQILGIGHNGHIGFNEPARALLGRTHVVELKQETRKANVRFFDRIEEVPKQAITMGLKTIFQSEKIVLLVQGADKTAIVHQALEGPITTECPASLLQLHPNLFVILDDEAGRGF